MTNRRRLLLSYLANSFKFLPYSYEYLYYGLVPTTINGKQVRNKAKVSKLYGNSVVENQLVNRDTTTFTNNGITSTFDKQTGIYTLSGQTTTTYFQITPSIGFSVVSGHRYLMIMNILTNPNNVSLRFCDINDGNFRTPAITKGLSTNIVVRSGATETHTLGFEGNTFTSGTDMSGITFILEIIDLTQAYPFDTPTTLTDNRVQEILNRGYIPYNLGEIKDTDIGEISSEDSNNNPLSTITFKYQGSGVGTAHDTYELTKTAHVFTKNISRVLASSLTWVDYSGRIVSSTLNDVIASILSENVMPNLLFNKYTTSIFNDNVDKTITQQDNKWINVRDSSLTASSFISSLTNNDYIEYKLATPQVITIPRKHLGVVDLGSLTWHYDSESGHETMFSEVVNNIAKPSSSDVMANIYTNKYLSANWSNLYSHNGKNIIAIQGNGRIRVYADDMGTNASDFKTSLSGVYLWYETEDEVADITDTFDIQSGGTINTDSNVLPNADFLMKCK